MPRRFLKDNVPSEDEEVVRRLKAAGAIVLAKTNTPEFACGANTNNTLFGPTRNPWNPALSPAGSSGGSAVAVATGMTPLAQGTDYGCSIRIPAAFCGIVGIRPTPGLIPSYPKPLAWDPGEVHGPLARDAEDAALMLDAMVGFSRISPISVAPPWQSALAELERREDIKGLRIAYVSDIAGIGVEAEIDATCRDAAAALGKLGAHVEHIAFDVSAGRAPYQTWRGFWMVGGSTSGSRKSKGWPQSERQCRSRTETERDRLCRRRADPHGDVRSLPQAVRALRRSAHAGGAGEALSVEMNFPDTINGQSFENYIDWIAPAYLITLVSLPAATAPAGLSHDGLPIGMQIVAPRFEEPLILRVARLIHQASNVGRPPIAG